MLQFGRYSDGKSTTSQLLSLIDRHTIDSPSSIQLYIDEIIQWYSELEDNIKEEYRLRIFSILARLCFWLNISEEEMYLKCAHFQQDGYLVSHFLLLQDTAHCCGLSLSNQLGIASAHESIIQRTPVKGVRFEHLLMSDSKYLLYRPRKSGFFSVLENIICASIIASAHNKRILIDLDGDWWIYPISFVDIFGSFFPCYQTVKKYADVKNVNSISFELMRAMFSTLCESDPGFIFERKRVYYSDFYQFMRRLSTIDPKILDSASESGVLYVRAGDKLVYEAIKIPDSFYIEDIGSLLKDCEDVFIISDDYGFAQRLVKASGHARVHNSTESIFSGYFNSDVNSKLTRKDRPTTDDIRAMINNFVMISSASLSASCPSTNITNCAHWSARFYKSLHLRSVPIEKYLML